MTKSRTIVARVFQSIPLQVDALIPLDEQASHHVGRVLRAAINDRLILFNGTGSEYEAVIQGISKKCVTVHITAQHTHTVESPLQLHLVQGIARGEKMDVIVQKAVELGVSAITPLITARCNVRLSGDRCDKRLQHWQAVAVSAAEQSGRQLVPQIHAPVTLSTWLNQPRAGLTYVLSPHVASKLAVQGVPQPTPLTVMIGPEGGFSDEEVALAVEHGALPLNLGPRVLRTETASIAALSVLQFCYGDMH